ncbi:MAG TPA: methionine--tRNA ligase [Candidatus Limnocylindria bacterium]|nr:methionine--tRNA ligase [Candidatus Limnocylindria bacterium]
MTKHTFYVTTPIYYVTAKPHLGSLYSTVLADVAARWNKLQGKQVFFLTGTDEHGQKIAQAAAKAGKEPKEFVDSFIPAYQQAWKSYEIDYTYFIRTTDPDHVKAVQDWLRRLMAQGDVYKDVYKGWYCTSDETFVTEKVAEHEVVQKGEAPLCPSCGRGTEWVAEETYFFRLSAYQDRLLSFYEQHPDFVLPKERIHEVINFVKSGLRDLSISRTTVTWGIPFPDAPHHVTYVWADALTNYITAIGYGNPSKEAFFQQWWPADVQVMGKDIVRFHAIYWPAFLMASGLALPKHLLVHGWITVDKQKMSKSFGNVVDPMMLHSLYGAEPVRYYLVRQLAVTHDSEFSIADLEQKISSDLADALGNLLNRLTSLAHQHSVVEIQPLAIWAQEAIDLRDACLTMVEDMTQYMNDYSYHMAYARLWQFINTTNAYFHSQEPWKVAKKDPALFVQILSATSHSLRAIALLLRPVMPKKMEQLLDSLGVAFSLQHENLAQLELGMWHHSFALKKIPTLFHKPEVKVAESNTALPQTEISSERTVQPVVPDNTITIDDLTKVQLLVGTIEQCEAMPQSDKMLRMQVNFGDKGMRQILAGVKQSYTPEQLLNKQATFVFNLSPRKMMGTESQGMMLVAEAADGKVKIMMPEAPVPNGTRLR